MSTCPSQAQQIAPLTTPQCAAGAFLNWRLIYLSLCWFLVATTCESLGCLLCLSFNAAASA